MYYKIKNFYHNKSGILVKLYEMCVLVYEILANKNRELYACANKVVATKKKDAVTGTASWYEMM